MDMHEDLSEITSKLAVAVERITQLERRCDKKDAKIEALEAFQNKSLGYAAAVAAIMQILGPAISKLLENGALK